MPISLPGVQYPKSVTAVVLRGPAPSRVLGLSAYQANVPGGYGNVGFGVNGQTFTMTNAASVACHLRQNMRRNGEPILSISYEDRRWKWRYASVCGHFNERLPDNSIRFSPTHDKWRRSARDLFQFLLSACGDSNADVSAAPNNVHPECHWHDVPCDRALDWLCRQTWCSLILDYTTDRVKVVRRGNGVNLPDLPTKTHISTAVRIGAVPDGIAVGCGPTRYQSKLLLEPVGLDTDGYVKKIDDLSYKPAGGWTRSWPGAFSEVTFGKARSLASRTVWRWYRVAGQASGGLSIPSSPQIVKSAAQYQLTNWLVDTGKDPDQMPTPIPAYIQGTYYPQCDFQANSATADYNPAPFTILPELNVVEFSYPVWYANDGYEKPTLYLTTSYYLKDADGEGLVSYHPRRTLGHAPVGTADWRFPHPELWMTHVVRYVNDDTSVLRVDNNLSTLEPETTEYLDRASEALTNLTVTDKTYAGVGTYPLDGRLESEVVEYGESQLPTSRYGEMHEHDIFTDDYHRRTL